MTLNCFRISEFYEAESRIMKLVGQSNQRNGSYLSQTTVKKCVKFYAMLVDWSLKRIVLGIENILVAKKARLLD